MRELLTTVLDLLGALALVAAAVVAVWPFSAALGLLVAGAGLLAVSWLTDRQARAAAVRRRRRSVQQ